MSDKTVGFAIVGCGTIGPWHAAALARCPGGRLVACVDLIRERAQKTAQDYQAQVLKYQHVKVPAPKVYTTLPPALRLAAVDVVSVCVPSGLHAEIGVAAARAGKHILCEKPLDITLTKIDALIEAAREHGVHLSGIFQRRFLPDAIRMKECIQGGRLGKILQADCSVKWYRSQGYYDSGDWRGTWELDGGGCLMNQGVHGVDLLQWLAGPVAWVQAWCATVDRKVEVETQAMAVLGFRNGAHGTIQGSTVCYPGEPIIHSIFGTKGSIQINDSFLSGWEFLKPGKEDKAIAAAIKEPQEGATGGDPLAALGEVGDSHYPQVREMIEVVQRGGVPSCPGSDARHAVEIILAIYESGRRGGERIHLPLKEDFLARPFPKVQRGN